MTILFGLALSIMTIAVIAYPLFFHRVTDFISNQQGTQDFNEQDALLSALSELEEDYKLDRLSEADFQRLKLHFQRRYLDAKKSAEKKES